MTSGRIVVIAAIVSAVSSAGVFFGLRAVVGMGRAGRHGAATGKQVAASAGGARTGATGASVAKSGAAGGTPSSVKRTVNVPTVAGRKLASALRALMDIGLRVDKVQRQQHATVAPDMVIRTSPPAGTPLMTGARVNVVVSSGSPQVEVPRVRGMAEAAARRRLTKAGFKVRSTRKYDEDKMEGVVLSQRPRSTDKAAPGATVTIVVNRE